jgi:3,2-trans-enoyl-CoA isomerase
VVWELLFICLYFDYRFQDSMRNVISNRQAELALTAGRMFASDEALKIGLIDEVATDKADAVAKAEKFLVGMSKISGNYGFAYRLLECGSRYRH